MKNSYQIPRTKFHCSKIKDKCGALMTRFLGIDFGTKYTGIALSDHGGTLAFPLTSFNRFSRAQLQEAINGLINTYEVETIVVGLPISLDGILHGQGMKTHSFIEYLRLHLSIPVHPWNEQYSTQIATQFLQDAGHKPSKDKGPLNASAATVILQDYLDTHRLERNEY
ncbi:Holliday junction resolvase RuvX [SAR202 cluster bacterium AD-802-E10_MRT_200m]|nr:Holliday junction resolvase RuvX [SAR202 cluster bacterium AD-802-E10_MRT_200m]